MSSRRPNASLRAVACTDYSVPGRAPWTTLTRYPPPGQPRPCLPTLTLTLTPTANCQLPTEILPHTRLQRERTVLNYSITRQVPCPRAQCELPSRSSMVPQTRSRASDGLTRVSYYEPPPPTTEPAPKSKTAKKPKVYRRSDPTPEQVHFPARKKTVRTYGKGRRSLPSKTPDQSTLTQIGWIPSTFQEEEDDDLGELIEPRSTLR